MSSRNQNELELLIETQKMPLETLKAFIDGGLIQNELPFELIAKDYPELLKDWYPGYPGVPRIMTEDDPFPLQGIIKDGKVTFKSLPGLKNIQLNDCTLSDGEYEVWLKKNADGSYSFHVMEDDAVLAY